MNNCFFKFLPLLLLTITLGVAAPTRDARAAPVQERINGIWAMTDCARPHLVMGYSRHFILTSTPSNNILQRLGPVESRMADTVLRVDNGGVPYDLKTTNDGILMRFDVGDTRLLPAPDADPFANEKAYFLLRFTRCDKVFSDKPGVDTDGLAAFRMLDSVEDVCHGKTLATDRPCRQAVFNAFDTDADGRLDGEELSRAYRQIVFLAASHGCDLHTHFPAQTNVEAPAFARHVMAYADLNDSAGVTLMELETRWPALAAQQGTEKFQTIIGHLGYLLHWLPLGTPLTGCVCTPPPSPDDGVQ